MNMRKPIAVLVCSAALVSFAADITVPDDIEIPAGGLTIDVPSGDTKTYTGVLSGSGKITKTGAGTLVLSGANTFSGGIGWAAGVVRVDREGALGTGTVDVQTGAGGLVFNAPDASFPNKIHKYDGSTLFMHFKADTTLTGSVVSDYNCDPIVNVDSGVTVVFEGKVQGRAEKDKGNNRGFQFNAIGGGTVIFRNDLIMPVLHDWGNGKNNAGGTVELWGQGDYFYGNSDGKGGGIEFGGLTYVCRAENVLNGAVLNRSRNRDYKSELDLNGCDQTIRGFTYNTGDVAWQNQVGGTVVSEEPATLTVTGRGENLTDGCNFEIDGKVTLLLDAGSDYTLNFVHRVCKTTGGIIVRGGTFDAGDATFRNVPAISVEENGKFRLTVAGTGALTGLKTLSVAAGGSFEVGNDPTAPFTADQLAVELGSGAKLSLPAGMSLKVVSLTVGGVRKTAGEYSSANCDEILSGTLVVPGATVAATWTGGGLADELVSTKENWQSESAFDLAGDSLEATFATGGTNAVFDVPVKFTDIALTATNFGFTAVGKGRMSVDGGITTTAIAGDPVRRFEFAAPLAFTSGQTLEVPAGTTFAFSNLDSPSKVTVVKSGAGTLEFSGTNVISGRLNVDEGKNVITGLITTPDGVVDVNPASTIPLDQALNFGSDKEKSIRLEGATIDKPLVLGHAANAYRSLTVAANTTNELRSAFINANLSSQGFYLDEGSVLICSGGVQQVTPWYIQGTGTWIVRNKPIRWYSSNTDKWLVLNSNSDAAKRLDLVIEVRDNKHNFQITDYGGTIDCRTNDAFAAGSRLKMDARWNGYSYLELNSTTQSFDTVNIDFGAFASDYAYGCCAVMGDAGAALGIRGTGASKINAPIVGNVSILKDGAGTLTLTNRAFASTGDLVISGGTLSIRAASWLNGTNVTVSGTGTLDLPTTAVFNRKFANLHLAGDGIIAIPSGTTAKFKHVTVDGVEIRPGAYTYETAPEDLKKHMTADSGMLVSKGDGLMLIVR